MGPERFPVSLREAERRSNLRALTDGGCFASLAITAAVDEPTRSERALNDAARGDARSDSDYDIAVFRNDPDSFVSGLRGRPSPFRRKPKVRLPRRLSKDSTRHLRRGVNPMTRQLISQPSPPITAPSPTFASPPPPPQSPALPRSPPAPPTPPRPAPELSRPSAPAAPNHPPPRSPPARE